MLIVASKTTLFMAALAFIAVGIFASFAVNKLRTVQAKKPEKQSNRNNKKPNNSNRRYENKKEN